MAKRTKARDKLDLQSDEPVAANPFSTLAGLRDSLPPGEQLLEAAEPPAPSRLFAAKVVLNHERKGRGGKTVTVLAGVLLVDEARAQFMRELSQALGTNVRDEGDNIVLAGDQRTRARSWLEARGAGRVVTSG